MWSKRVPDPYAAGRYLICPAEWTLELEVPGFNTYDWAPGDHSCCYGERGRTYTVTLQHRLWYLYRWNDHHHRSVSAGWILTRSGYLRVRYWGRSYWMLVLTCQTITGNTAKLPRPLRRQKKGLTGYWVPPLCGTHGDTIIVSPCLLFLNIAQCISPQWWRTQWCIPGVVYGLKFSINSGIYNRWGDMIFGTNDYTVGWDGTYQEKNNLLVLMCWFNAVTWKVIRSYHSGSGDTQWWRLG